MKRVIIWIASFCLLLLIGPSFVEGAAINKQFIIINKHNNQLAFYDGDKSPRIFSVSTGKNQSLTPEGMFKIVNRIKNRPYYTRNIPGGDPRNPLGDRWLGLNARGTWGTTYAIHGNSNASSIGKYVSDGCVRMHNHEVRWLFEQVKTNAPVLITDSRLSFDELVAVHGLKAVKIDKVDTHVMVYEPVKLYSKPNGLGNTGQVLAPQQVKAFERAGDWYHIPTWFGNAWFKATPGQTFIGGAPVKKVDTVITLLKDAKLYKKPYGYGHTGQIIGAQPITAFEQAGDWYRVKTWVGDVWLKATNDTAIIGGEPIEKVDTIITLLNETKLYSRPNGIGGTGKELNAQSITAFEKSGDWYRVKTWFGDAWLKATTDNALIGGEPVEQINTVITLTQPTMLYAEPNKLSNTLNSLGAQPVTAFEKSGDWYRVKTWFGDAWLNATTDNALIGREPVEKINTVITLTEPTTLYAEPNRLSNTLNTLDAQPVTAFEKSGDWYRVNTWFGDAWLEAPYEQ